MSTTPRGPQRSARPARFERHAPGNAFHNARTAPSCEAPMKTIDVLFPKFREPTFRTAEEAIADGARRSRSELGLQVRNQKIAEVRWSATEFFALLEGQPGGLRIRRQDDVLAAELTQDIPDD